MKDSIYILDTNILLFDARALWNFPGQRLLVPIEVIGDLDNFKHGTDETARNARAAALAFDELRKKGSLKEGVTIENGSVIKVAGPVQPGIRSDAALLILAEQLLKRKERPILVTKSVNLRVKADALGLEAQDYGQDTPVDTDTMRGWVRIAASEKTLAALREGEPVSAKRFKLHSNQYAFLHEKENPSKGVCARFHADEGVLRKLSEANRSACGIRSLNIEQTFSLDALMDPAITLVTLAGRAGTGKTLLAIAAALQQIFGQKRYEKLLVFRPTMPVSRDLGYLPGDINDKMRPWMQPVYDALELIRSMDRRGGRLLPNDVLNCPEISVEPLTYIRGRSIPNQFIIIDEAQNLTPLEVKTAITRVGLGSKVVLTGDPAQIDNPYVDARSNGLTRLVGRFLESPLAAHVTLVHGERSELAETASTLL